MGAQQSAAARSAKTQSPVAPATGARRIRAIYQNGVLKPIEALDLPEGVEVEITLRTERS